MFVREGRIWIIIFELSSQDRPRALEPSKKVDLHLEALGRSDRGRRRQHGRESAAELGDGNRGGIS